jgi:two-component system nitrogen regulation response regulator NtrX
MIGQSVPIRALGAQIAVAAPTNGRILIYGESNTGKEPRREPSITSLLGRSS